MIIIIYRFISYNAGSSLPINTRFVTFDNRSPFRTHDTQAYVPILCLIKPLLLNFSNSCLNFCELCQWIFVVFIFNYVCNIHCTDMSQCLPRKSSLNNIAVDLKARTLSSFTFRAKIFLQLQAVKAIFHPLRLI